MILNPDPFNLRIRQIKIYTLFKAQTWKLNDTLYNGKTKTKRLIATNKPPLNRLSCAIFSCDSSVLTDGLFLILLGVYAIEF